MIKEGPGQIENNLPGIQKNEHRKPDLTFSGGGTELTENTER